MNPQISTSAMERPFASNMSGHGCCLNISSHSSCLNVSSHGGGCLNVSGHAATGGNFADVSLSNIFADDEEKIDIFGETSMVGLICTLQIEATAKERLLSPQRNSNSVKSLKSSAGLLTWQGSCASFMGSGNELLDLSFSINDFDNYNDDLSLHKKASASTKISKGNEKNYSSGYGASKAKATDRGNGRKSRTQDKRSKSNIAPVKFNELTGRTLSGGMQSFSELVPDMAPRKPTRRQDEHQHQIHSTDTMPSNESEEINNASNIPQVIPGMDDQSVCSEVIKFDLSPSRKKKYQELVRTDSCPLVSGHDTFDTLTDTTLLMTPSTLSSEEQKEDEAPKCPRRGASPERSVVESSTTAMNKDMLVKHKTQIENSEKDTISNAALLRSPMKKSKNDNDKPLRSAFNGAPSLPTDSDIISSPKKKVMKIALKDLESYVVPENDRKSNKTAISSTKYKKIMKAATNEQFASNKNDNERIKVASSSGVVRSSESKASDIFVDPIQSPIPASISVHHGCPASLNSTEHSIDQSVSSMDDSSRHGSRVRCFPIPVQFSPQKSPTKSFTNRSIKSKDKFKEMIVLPPISHESPNTSRNTIESCHRTTTCNISQKTKSLDSRKSVPSTTTPRRFPKSNSCRSLKISDTTNNDDILLLKGNHKSLNRYKSGNALPPMPRKTPSPKKLPKTPSDLVGFDTIKNNICPINLDSPVSRPRPKLNDIPKAISWRGSKVDDHNHTSKTSRRIARATSCQILQSNNDIGHIIVPSIESTSNTKNRCGKIDSSPLPPRSPYKTMSPQKIPKTIAQNETNYNDCSKHYSECSVPPIMISSPQMMMVDKNDTTHKIITGSMTKICNRDKPPTTPKRYKNYQDEIEE